MEMKKKFLELRRRRSVLIRRLQRMGPELLRGSLIERYKKCGKPGCKCVTGRGHGPKYYLSVSLPGAKPDMIYVPQAYVEKVESCMMDLKEVRNLIEEICEINRLLLREREL